jgi:hypothetical protein
MYEYEYTSTVKAPVVCAQILVILLTVPCIHRAMAVDSSILCPATPAAFGEILLAEDPSKLYNLRIGILTLVTTGVQSHTSYIVPSILSSRIGGHVG